MKFNGEYKFEEWLRLFPTIGNGTTIPPMINPLGREWKQPDRSSILFVDKRDSRVPLKPEDDNEKFKYAALMTKESMDLLLRYDTSTPTGAYPGKMWKKTTHNGLTVLCWFGYHINDDYFSNGYAPIVVVSLRELKEEQIRRNCWVTRQTTS